MRPCNVLVLIFGMLWVLALGLLVVGQFGLLGQEPDPLAGVFLLPLGLPWILFVDAAPEAAWPWLAAASPLVNLIVLMAICRLVARLPK